MSRPQFGFLTGFLIAWIWAAQGFLPALAAVVAGLIGLLATRVLDGDTDLGELTERVVGRRD